MNKGMLVGLSVLLLLACARTGAAQQNKASPELWRTVKTEGVVRVKVGLDVPRQVDQESTRYAVSSYRQQDITAAQNELLAELTGATYQIINQSPSVPSISMEVGPDALAVLERSKLVNYIVNDPVTLYRQWASRPKSPPSHKVHPRVWKKVKEKGSVKVIVELDMPWQWEGKLSKDKIPAQRKAIAEAQKRLLADLVGTNHKLGSLFPLSPMISIEVDAHALKML